MDYLIGMDLGTTNIKAVLMNTEGECIASASRANQMIMPEKGFVEQNANAWWQSAKEIFRELALQAGQEAVSGIRGIAVSSQSVTLLPIGSDGRPLYNAIIWMDSRSGAEMNEIIEEVGLEQYIQIVGGRPDAAFLPSKLRWLRKNHPEILRQTAFLLQASSYIVYRLTDAAVTDLDQAIRSQCLDIKSMKWSAVIGSAIGVDLDMLLPTPIPSDAIAGYVSDEASSITGLPSGIPVTAGACDALAAVYATGLFHLGEAAESAGTSSLVFAGADRSNSLTDPIVARPCSIGDYSHLYDAPISTTGACLKWYLDTFGEAERREAERKGIDVYQELDHMASEAAPGCGGLIFLPYLMGERAPLWSTSARGAFLGLTLNTARSDMVRSIFEGTTFALRHVIETIQKNGVQIECLKIAGGGAKSRIWAKIKASVLNIPILLMDERAGDVPMGDVLIAGQAVGLFSDIGKEADKFIRVRETICPDPAWTEIYDRMYEYYRSMYKALEPDYCRLEGTRPWAAE